MAWTSRCGQQNTKRLYKGATEYVYKNDVKEKIDHVADKAKNATEKVADEAKNAAHKLGEKLKQAGDKVKHSTD
jgi:hypothetical protein